MDAEMEKLHSLLVEVVQRLEIFKKYVEKEKAAIAAEYGAEKVAKLDAYYEAAVAKLKAERGANYDPSDEEMIELLKIEEEAE